MPHQFPNYIKRFNPRARGGRDSNSLTCQWVTIRFNPRARGGRDVRPPGNRHYFQRFNPRARGGRDLNRPATCSTTSFVSIHAPAGGATQLKYSLPTVNNSFNPRARGGRDTNRSFEHILRQVSIHAPAGGATEPGALKFDQGSQFQSTRPRGARQRTSANVFSISSFNPRARGGRDILEHNIVIRQSTFQSTRPRGARRIIALSF